MTREGIERYRGERRTSEKWPMELGGIRGGTWGTGMLEWLGDSWGKLSGGGSAGSVLRSQGTWGQAGLSRCRAMGIKMSTFLCSLQPGPAAAGLIGSLSLYWGVIVASEEKQSSLTRCVGVLVLGTWRRWGLWGVEAFGVPQRGAAYQPGVKPRVWRTTGAF